MCSIDWAALGTWVAVAVALGISLQDTWRRRYNERFERKAVAEMLRAELDRLGVAASDLQKEAAKHVGPGDLESILKTDAGTFAAEVTPFLVRLAAPAWETLVARSPIIGADAAGKVVKAFASFALLRTLCENISHKRETTMLDAESVRDISGQAIRAAAAAATACRAVPDIRG